jgi:hypothetical protein
VCLFKKRPGIMGWDTEIVKGFINICLTDFGRHQQKRPGPGRKPVAGSGRNPGELLAVFPMQETGEKADQSRPA